jgi:ribose transport system ATP-binding protein
VSIPVDRELMNGPRSLELRHISKVFAGQYALDDVNLVLRPGRVLALLGANGSGKSTLIKVLAGYHTPEHGGQVFAHGASVALGSPAASHSCGIRIVHQDLGLVDSLTVAENLALTRHSDSRRSDSMRWISSRNERRGVRELLERYQLDVQPDQLAGSLRPAQRSMIAIIRAVEDGLDQSGILVLDEPTASLPPSEVEQLLALLRVLRARGVAILYVSHRLPEVLAIADDIVVLRDGRVVAERSIGEVDADRLVELILGTALEANPDRRHDQTSDVVLEAAGLRGGLVRYVDLCVHRGEVLGLTGLIGSGYETVLAMMFGATPRRTGSVLLDGTPVGEQPGSAIRAGIAYVPPERRHGVMPDWTVRENLTLPYLRASGPARWMTARAERSEAIEWIDRLSVKPSDPEADFMTLSGGNQQKVVIARWLRCGARAFLIDEPTTGVDAAAKRAIHGELRAAADAGAAVILASSDLEELSEVSDRVLVMGGGRVVTELTDPSEPERLLAEALRAANVV